MTKITEWSECKDVSEKLARPTHGISVPDSWTNFEYGGEPSICSLKVVGNIPLTRWCGLVNPAQDTSVCVIFRAFE